MKVAKVREKRERRQKMSGIRPISSTNSGFSTINTGRNSADSSHAYIASRINDLYLQALSRQQSSSGARTLRRFIDSNSKDGAKLHKIV